jgi:hypothetical protein
MAHFVALTKRIPSYYTNFLIAIILRNIFRYPLELQKGDPFTSLPMLQHFNSTKLVIVITNTSDFTTAAILL